MSENKKGTVVIVSGPSGVGKSTICREVAKRLTDVHLSVSATTRPRAENEVDGKDYWFISKEEFEKRLYNGLFMEFAEVFDNYYGTPRDKVDEILSAGKTVMLEIDVQGARKVKRIYPEAKMVFILPPNKNKLVQRMNHRARDDTDMSARRLNHADSEIAAAWQYYEHMIINDDLEQAVEELVDVIKMNSGDK